MLVLHREHTGIYLGTIASIVATMAMLICVYQSKALLLFQPDKTHSIVIKIQNTEKNHYTIFSDVDQFFYIPQQLNQFDAYVKKRAEFLELHAILTMQTSSKSNNVKIISNKSLGPEFSFKIVDIFKKNGFSNFDFSVEKKTIF